MDTQLSKDIKEFRGEKAKASLHADRAKEVQGRIIDLMDQENIPSYEVEVGREVVRATVVGDGTTTEIDAAKLQASVTDEQWQQITQRVLDKNLLEAAIQLNLISAKTVAECSYEKPKAKYVKLTTKK